MTATRRAPAFECAARQDTVRVLVLGAGFGGLYCASYLHQELSEREDVEVLLVNRDNFFTFSPMLHEVAGGGVGTHHILQPVRPLLHGKKPRFLQARVELVDLEARQVHTSAGPLRYDFLVLALGSVTDFFGVPGAAAHCLTLKSITGALQIRSRVIQAVESATGRGGALALTVVGAGPAGVELIADLADLVRDMLAHEEPDSRPEVSLRLLQSGPRILPGLPDRLAEAALRALRAKGIAVRTDTRVTAVHAEGVELDGSDFLPSDVTVWTAGVRPHPIVDSLPTPRDPRGRVCVNEYLQLLGAANVYAIGDLACCQDARTGGPLPPIAAVAMRQGIRAAANIGAALNGHPPEAFEYSYLGNLVSLGTRSAVVDLLGVPVTGFGAWLLWRTLYLFKMVGLAPKVRVALDWMTALLVGRETSRLP